MKRYSTSIDFKFWILKRATGKIIGTLFLFIFSFLINSNYPRAAEEIRFSSNERTIITSVIDQFKRECGHTAVLDETKLKEIQDFYQANKDSLNQDLKNCYGEYLSQLVAIHNIHQQTCNEVTPKKNYGKDKDFARLFTNVRKFQNGIRIYHEKLNECLVRKGADPK